VRHEIEGYNRMFLTGGTAALDAILDQVARDNKSVHWAHIPDVSTALLSDWIRSSQNYRLVKSSEGDVAFVRDAGESLDYSANAKYFAAHTDGLYYTVPPQFSVLACLDPGSAQVPTFFIDTTKAIDILKGCDSPALTTLRKLDQVFLGRDGSEYRRRLIEINPLTEEEAMNITLGRAYVRPSMGLSMADVPHQKEIAEALQLLFVSLETATVLEHRWTLGDVLVWDNHRFIHGRPDASRSAGRLLARAWFSSGT
jgi:alpha-ketoglutarate-dependent taurine dioxygenase